MKEKIYSSIELHPQFALNGKAYVVGGDDGHPGKSGDWRV